MITQVPINSSRIDFKTPSIRINHRRGNSLSTITEPTNRKQFFAGPTQSKAQVRAPNPKHLQGIGSTHAGMSLKFGGQHNDSKGVFTMNNKNPILVMNTEHLGTKPTPFFHFASTGGELLAQHPKPVMVNDPSSVTT